MYYMLTLCSTWQQKENKKYVTPWQQTLASPIDRLYGNSFGSISKSTDNVIQATKTAQKHKQSKKESDLKNSIHCIADKMILIYVNTHIETGYILFHL